MAIKSMLVCFMLVCVLLVDACDRCRGHGSNCHRKRRSSDSLDNVHDGSCERRGTQYDIPLPSNPCYFNSYDANLDGEITESELRALLGDSEHTDALFVDLDVDVMAGDGVITPDEFCCMTFRFKTECAECSKK